MSRDLVTHDPACTVPIADHNGLEPCLRVIDETPVPPKEVVVAHYTEGSQGQQISDFRADYIERYGVSTTPIASHVEDRRDNRDPEAVGNAFLARLNGGH